MFKKVFSTFSRALGGKESPAPVAAPAKAEQPPVEAKNDKSKAAPAAVKAPAAKAPPAKAAPPEPTKSPEELCGIDAKMSKDQIKAHLAFLYRRYNRATSSLDQKLRKEADVMLDAVVAIREKVFGPM